MTVLVVSVPLSLIFGPSSLKPNGPALYLRTLLGREGKDAHQALGRMLGMVSVGG